jgi:hypothetical protein
MSLEWVLNSNFDIIYIINYAQYRGIYIYIVGVDRKRGSFFILFRSGQKCVWEGEQVLGVDWKGWQVFKTVKHKKNNKKRLFRQCPYITIFSLFCCSHIKKLSFFLNFCQISSYAIAILFFFNYFLLTGTSYKNITI